MSFKCFKETKTTRRKVCSFKQCGPLHRKSLSKRSENENKRKKNHTKYSKDFIQNAVDKVNEGLSVPSVSKELKIPRRTLYTWTRKLAENPENLNISNSHQIYSEDFKKTAIEKVTNGISVSKVSIDMKIPTRTLYTWTKTKRTRRNLSYDLESLNIS